VMNNPTNSLSYLEPLSNKLKCGGVIHLYNIMDKGEKLEIRDFLGSEFECVFEREVHPYSPQSSLKVFDILKSFSNVQSTNQ
jgi:tRNA G37 N-methylase Trm5